MKRFKAADLSFSLPQSWDEVTFGQERALYAATSSLEALSALSGLTTEQLRSINAITADTIVNEHLGFLAQRPKWNTLPIPGSVKVGSATLKQRILHRLGVTRKLPVGEKTITIPQSIGSETSYGQKLDIDAELNQMELGEDDDANLHQVAPLLLCVYLSPLITGKPYQDRVTAMACLAQIDTLPCTIALPLAAFFFVSYFRTISSGRNALPPLDFLTTTPPALLPN